MDVAATVLMFVPLIAILWVANLAQRRRITDEGSASRVLTGIAYFLLASLFVLLVLLGLLTHVAGVVEQGPAAANLEAALGTSSLDPGILPRVGLGMWLPALLGLVLLLPRVRDALARLIPIDPGSVVHAAALSLSTLIVVNLLMTLGIGLGNLATLAETSMVGDNTNLLGVLWAQDLTLTVMAMVGVGWLARRSLAETLRRLGLTVPSWRQVLLSVGVGLAMVPLVLAIELLLETVGIGPNADVERLSEQLIGPLAESIPGILTMGLAAAIGEETVFRGALQPRFGLWLTAALFALLHSTYGLTTSTLIVFGVGLVLGLMRRRFNTTSAMIVHAVYNMALGLISYLGLMQDL